MIENADKILLQETYRNSHMGANTINAIIDKIEDEDLSHDLNKRAAKYIEIQQKAAKELNEYGELAEGVSKIESAILKTSVKANTMLNNATDHIADIMINESITGIRDMKKAINENQEADGKAIRLAKELISFEKQNIEIMKSYL